jgi:hypothetical protein
MPRSLPKVILTAYTTNYRLTLYIYSVSYAEKKESGMGDEAKRIAGPSEEVVTVNIPAVRGRSPKSLALSREEALSLFMFFVPGHIGSAAITALMLLGTITGVVGGVSMLVWAVVSFFVCLWVYHWIDECGRRERAAALALTEMSRLASRVVSLYSRSAYSSDEGPRSVEVFALYQRAQQALESEDHRRAGQMIERGVALADELLEKSDEGPSTGALPGNTRDKAE